MVSEADEVLLDEQDIGYLRSRGYPLSSLKTEELRSIGVGQHDIEGVKFSVDKPGIVFVCRSMANTLIGLQVLTREEKAYRFYPHPDAKHLPIMYSTQEDRRLLYEVREMILVEGVHDG